ncbi:MAG: diguanylate cyclase [Colwellia sp.]
MKLLTLSKILGYTFLLMSYVPAAMAMTEKNIEYLSFGIGFSLGCLLLLLIFSAIGWYLNCQCRRQYDKVLQKFKLSKRAIHAVKKVMKKMVAEQQDNQYLLEDKVQERTLELNIALQELESANHELERKNTLDELTGLHNRRFYDQKILAEYRRSHRNHTPLSLVLIDIDHFKAVNDNYGHLAGDHCIVTLSKYIKRSLKRSTDKAFRYGGEEFCLILPNTDAEGALLMAEQLRVSISEQVFQFQDIKLCVTICCGVYTYQQQVNIGPEQMFSGADKALYQAKHNGRNQTKQYIFSE